MPKVFGNVSVWSEPAPENLSCWKKQTRKTLPDIFFSLNHCVSHLNLPLFCPESSERSLQPSKLFWETEDSQKEFWEQLSSRTLRNDPTVLRRLGGRGNVRKRGGSEKRSRGEVGMLRGKGRCLQVQNGRILPAACLLQFPSVFPQISCFP